ncbi:hypothetical protein DBR11_27970 [Pedobacter sp. HMWF019]|nr:hypothetical protein DBR11_27970 [Pedobacter sp. HMWF019]
MRAFIKRYICLLLATMIFKVKSITYNTLCLHKEVEIVLLDECSNQLVLSSECGGTEIKIELSDLDRSMLCLKENFTFFSLPDQIVLRPGKSIRSKGMHAEPIVLDFLSELDTEQLNKTLKLLILR